MTYTLAGRCLDISVPLPAEWEAWAGGTAGMRVRGVDLPPLSDARLVMRSAAAWEAREGRRGEVRVVEFQDATRRAQVTPDRGEAWVSGTLDHPLGGLVASTLLEGVALELHAAAVARDDRGLLLAGVSGAGKSTISVLVASLPGWRRLAEERVLAWPDPWRVQATPWPPGVARAATAMGLDAVLLLHHGAAPRARRLPPAEAAAALLRLSFFLPGSRVSVEAAGRLAARLSTEVPVWWVETTPTREAVARLIGFTERDVE